MKKGIIAVLITTFIWALTPIFIKILSFNFDAVTQGFYRYLGATILLLILSFCFSRTELLENFKKIKKFILPALVVSLFQISWTLSIQHSDPALANFLEKSYVIFVIIFSYLFLKEEREIIKSRNFIFGTIIVLVGIISIFLGEKSGNFEFDFGLILAIVAGVFWAFYLILIKKIVVDENPLVITSIVYFVATIFLFFFALIKGDLKQITLVPLNINFLLFFSGMLCVGIGDALNYTAIKYLGATLPAVIVLANAFITPIFSWAFFKEILTLPQIIGGIILICGTIIISSSRRL